jgi:hypothetical protein
LSVPKIREALRLKAEARLSNRQIGEAIGSARSTVQECLRRAKAAGDFCPLPPECDEDALIARVYPKAEIAPRYPTPDFVTIHAELARKGVTRMLVWQEYKAHHPGGCQFTQSPPDRSLCHSQIQWLYVCTGSAGLRSRD